MGFCTRWRKNQYSLDTDSDWTGCTHERKTATSYVFQLGSKVISWSSKKQAIVAVSSTKVEYVATTSATCEAVWLRRILGDLQVKTEGATIFFYDNMFVITMTKNLIFHSATKHIKIRHHFIQELVGKKEIKLQFCKTDEQLANIFTKVVPSEKFAYFESSSEYMIFLD